LDKKLFIYLNVKICHLIWKRFKVFYLLWS